MPHYRIVDLRDPAPAAQESLVPAKSPEAAVRELLGIDVVRSGHRRNLVARAYWQHPEQPPSMVRLYRRTEREAPG
jgi:hypothetical protein